MIGLILQLLVVALILGLIFWLVEQVPGIAPFARIIRVVAIVLFIIYVIYVLMSLLGGSGHVPALR